MATSTTADPNCPQCKGKGKIPCPSSTHIKARQLFPNSVAQFGVPCDMCDSSQEIVCSCIAPTVNVTVQWTKQGNIQWSEWWVKEHGKTLPQAPTEKDHVSFANYDLRRIGCPAITGNESSLKIDNVPHGKLTEVETVIVDHGFKFVSIL